MFVLWNNKKFRIEKEKTSDYNNGRNKKEQEIIRMLERSVKKLDKLVESLMEEFKL